MKGNEGPRPIIRRTKVIEGGGHHGGAWKVAYADFVTAMMAFFLLMWLLNATTEQQRKGLADYFAPSIPLARVSGGSDGMFGGDAPTQTNDVEAQDGGGPEPGTGGAPEFDDLPASLAEARETAALLAVEDVLLGRGGESLVADEALRHVVTRLTDEGLVIEIFAREGAPLFAAGTDRPLPVTEELLALVAYAAALVTNRVAVGGHLAAEAGPGAAAGAGAGADPGADPGADGRAWALSLGRAGRAGALLAAGGLAPARLARLTGHADRSPAVAAPMAPRNDRLEVVLLREARGGAVERGARLGSR